MILENRLKNRKTSALWSPSAPTVDGGTIYFGSSDGNLYAIERDTGQKVWKFSANAIGGRPPIPAAGIELIYFGGIKGRFFAVNKETGKANWAFKTDKVFKVFCTETQ